MKTNRTSAIVGACVGFAVFLAVAFLPAVSYGGYAGHLLGQGIGFETPMVVFGMILGVFAVGSLFTVLGAIAGTIISVLTGAKHAAAE